MSNAMADDAEANVAYVHAVRIGLQHTDAAGIVFFPRYYNLMQEASEAFLASRGLPPWGVMRDTHYYLPVVHSECNYRAALRWGDEIRIEVVVEEVRRRSFTTQFRFVCPDGRLGARGRIAQVSVDKTTHRAIPLPDELRQALGAP